MDTARGTAPVIEPAARPGRGGRAVDAGAPLAHRTAAVPAALAHRMAGVAAAPAHRMAGVAAALAHRGWDPLRALHQRLMPDYNAKATAYWWTVVLLGFGLVALSLHGVAALSLAAAGRTLLFTVLAMLAGLVPVRVPQTKNSFTAGEMFIFLLLLTDGPHAAALASSCEAAVGSWRTSKRWTSRIASPAMAAVAMYGAGSALHASLQALAAIGFGNDGVVLAATIVFAFGYFVLNTLLVTMVPRLKSNQPLKLGDFVGVFGWLGLAYAANASVATFLFIGLRHSGYASVVAAVPVIAILLSAGHFYFRREEANEAVRRTDAQQAAQREMMESARQAGMAEIATNVLHNVGNVLNSVNVSADLIAERLGRSEVPSLQRVVTLLDGQRADLGGFFSKDPRGGMLPDFLRQLAQTLQDEQQAVADELRRLRDSVRHIQQIVATQQSYAGARSVVEPVRVADLLEDALRINTSGPLERHVCLVRCAEGLPTLLLDKHRVLLILVNLVSNARHATAHLPHADVRIVLHASMEAVADGRRLRIAVEDNGEGIANDHLTRIFAHGFTTRKDGHGFGLHSCALAAREMGGALQAHSEGRGHGARFTLELPAQAADAGADPTAVPVAAATTATAIAAPQAPATP